MAADDALSPSTLHRTTFPAAKFTELGEQADFFDTPATSAAMSSAAAPAAKQGDAKVEWPLVQAGISDVSPLSDTAYIDTPLLHSDM